MLASGGEKRADRAFERLYRRHVKDVYRYASAVLANPTDAEDVAQTVFLNAYRAFQTGTRPEKPLNWLIAITHNVCRQRFRDGSRRPREVVLDPRIAAEPVDDAERYRREDVLRALSQLSLNQRAALAMRELEGRSYGEIASVLGTTKTAVETLLFRARRAFREQLEGALTCSEAERAISLQLDGMLSRADRGGLRAHLRACPDCASLARRFRAQGSALRGVMLAPLPASLAGGFGGGIIAAGTTGTAIGVKALAVGTAALVAAGVGTEVVTHARTKHSPADATSRRTPVAGEASRPSLELVSAQVTVASAHSSALRALRGSAATPHVGSVLAPTRRARRPPIRPTEVASVSPVTAGTQPSAPVGGLSAATPDATARTSTAARQQPQLSGGGDPRTPNGLAAGNRHVSSAPTHGRGHASTQAAGPTSSDDPTHPAHPAHPVHPTHPDKPSGGSDVPGGPPTATPAPDPQSAADVPVTPVSDQPPDQPPDPLPPPSPGGPSIDPPAANPPKPPKLPGPQGNAHGGGPPRP
jgi:RNA polymerase sigma-70 factor, ECF subfamily